MCVCVYVCMCIYIYIYMYAYICMNVCIYVRICMLVPCTVRTVHTTANPRSPAAHQNTINLARRFMFVEVSQRCQSDTESV